MNLHAHELEKILLARDIRIAKASSGWTITGPGGRAIQYAPATGMCWRFDSGLGMRKRQQLRGSAQRVAEIVEAMVR